MNQGIQTTLRLNDENATAQLGSDIAIVARRGDILCLRGELGAGKSTLARGAIRMLADDDRLEVPSPSFALCHEYALSPPVHHFDFYRLEAASELEELGLEEAIETGLCIIEWPGLAADLLPRAAVTIEIDSDEDGRVAKIDSALRESGSFYGRIMRSLEIRRFLDKHWCEGTHRRFLEGDASTRRYETAEAGGETRIIMDAPAQPDGPSIYQGNSYSRIAKLAEDVVPFIAVDRTLREAGFAAPEIFCADVGRGLLLTEHMGDGRIVTEAGEPITDRYLHAARLLAAIHRHTWPEKIEFHDVSGALFEHQISQYDEAAMQIETSLFADWYAPRHMGRELNETERQEFRDIWSELFAQLSNSPPTLVLRDFHSPNLIWRESDPAPRKIGLIDFQDALIGPAAYDVASLAQDARVDMEPELEEMVLRTYLDSRGEDPEFDPQRFRAEFAIMAAQRATKILGIFVRLDMRDGKPDYLRHLPRMRRYLKKSLRMPILTRYRHWCDIVAGL